MASPKSKPVHSVMLSSHLVFCLPFLLPPCTVPCRIIFASPVDLVICQYHLSLRGGGGGEGGGVHSSEKIFTGLNGLPDYVPRFLICNVISVGDAQKSSKPSLSVISQLTIPHRPDVGTMTASSGKFLGPKAAKSHQPECRMPVGLMAGRWQHVDQMPNKSGIGPPAGRLKMPTAGWCRFAEQMPSICQANPTLARQGADARSYSGPRSGHQQCRRWPDSDTMGILTAGRRRVTTWMQTKTALAWQWPDGHTNSGPTSGYHLNADQMPINTISGLTTSRWAFRQRADFGFSTSARCRVCLTIDRQINNTHRPSWHLTDAVLLTLGRCCADIGLIHLCQHPGDVVLAATVSFQCIADKELTSPWWQRPAMAMKCGPQEK